MSRPDAAALRAALAALGRSRGMRPGLERIRAASARLGHPAEAYPAIHVAGTNGKGSICHLAARLLAAHGLRVGLTTSPHLHRLAERLVVDGRPMEDEDLAVLGAEVAAELGGWEASGLTFFEAVTLLAFAGFRRRGVDAAVVEVGLGGRLDATRLCRPVVSVIASIGLDHTEWLGPDEASIAAEKAGILVPGVPLLLGPVSPEAAAVIAARAAAVGSPVHRLAADGGAVEGPEGPLGPPCPAPLDGPHQQANAALAGAAATLLLRALHRTPEPQRYRLPPFVLPGRLEPLPGAPPTLLDVAHNPHAAVALARHLAGRRLRPRWVVGLLAAKDADGFLAALRPLGGTLHACAPSVPGARPAADLAAAWGPGTPVHADPVSAWEAARGAAAPGETLVVCGSFHTVAAVRAAALGLRQVDPERVLL